MKRIEDLLALLILFVMGIFLVLLLVIIPLLARLP